MSAEQDQEWRGYCDRGVCAAELGHDGTCAEASGWADEPEVTIDQEAARRAAVDQAIAEAKAYMRAQR